MSMVVLVMYVVLFKYLYVALSDMFSLFFQLRALCQINSTVLKYILSIYKAFISISSLT